MQREALQLDIEKSYKGLSDLIVGMQTKMDLLTNEKHDLDQKILALKVTELENTNSLLQKIAEYQRKKACKKLESLGTYALQYSLGEDYEMIIEIEDIKSKPYANIYVNKKSSGVKTDPMENNGGGVIDIISAALRVVTMQTYEPFIDGPIIFDEPFKMVSKEFVPQMAEFIKKIGEDFNRQIIMVTHNEYLAAIAEHKILVKQDRETCESIIEIIN